MSQPKLRAVRRWRKDAGVALVTAIFLLVVLAGLGVAIVSIVTSQRSSASMDEQGSRAYQAARAGIEWGLLVKLRGGELTPVVSISCPSPGTGYTFAMPPNTSLSAFTVTVTCSALTNGHYILGATACNSPVHPDATVSCPNVVFGPDYVQRKVEVQL